jgi:hypothetical protein
LAATKPRHARGCAQLPGFRLLCTRDFERPLETGFGFCGIRLWRHQGDFAGDAMNLGLAPFFLCRFDRRDGSQSVLLAGPGSCGIVAGERLDHH